MKKLFSDFLKHPWIFTILTGAIGGAIGTIFVDWLKGFEFLSTARGILKLMYDFLTTSLILPVYSLINALVLTFFLSRVWFHLRLKRNSEPLQEKKNAVQNTHDFGGDYKSDIFNGIKYSWRWERRGDGKYYSADFRANCPKCSNWIIDDECIRCRAQFHNRILSDRDLEKRVIAELVHRYSQKSSDNLTNS